MEQLGVAAILPLDAHRELAEFFDRFMLEFDEPKRPPAPLTIVPLASEGA